MVDPKAYKFAFHGYVDSPETLRQLEVAKADLDTALRLLRVLGEDTAGDCPFCGAGAGLVTHTVDCELKLFLAAHPEEEG